MIYQVRLNLEDGNELLDLRRSRLIQSVFLVYT
jgi:hypothetical protein